MAKRRRRRSFHGLGLPPEDHLRKFSAFLQESARESSDGYRALDTALTAKNPMDVARACDGAFTPMIAAAAYAEVAKDQMNSGALVSAQQIRAFEATIKQSNKLALDFRAACIGFAPTGKAVARRISSWRGAFPK